MKKLSRNFMLSFWDKKQYIHLGGWCKEFIKFFALKEQDFNLVNGRYYYHPSTNSIVLEKSEQEFCQQEGRNVPVFVQIKLPFLPTFRKTHGQPNGTWYACNEISKKENEKINMRYTWKGGKHYSRSWEEGERYSFVSFFFCNINIKKAVGDKMKLVFSEWKEERQKLHDRTIF